MPAHAQWLCQAHEEHVASSVIMLGKGSAAGESGEDSLPPPDTNDDDIPF